MCGIVAALGVPDPTIVREMMTRMHHRGPDGEGVLRVGNAWLGHVRLAIVDPAGGYQPLVNEAGDVGVAFNGEIYNHRNLRAQLLDRHAFSTSCDTEVLVHLYEERREHLVSDLDGMFAFGLATPDGLLLARDPMGIKPLYYGRRGNAFLVASELKAFPEMDELSALPAGHACFAGEAPHRFSLPCAPMPLPGLTLDQALRGVRKGLDDAVAKRLMGDVPVGVFLSGGLDSSIVAALMRRHVSHLHSFAAGMEGAPDLAAARRMADHLGTEHHEIVYTAEEAVAVLPDVIASLESFDAPLVRSAVPCWFVSRLAARFVKVVLTGEGADELFAGYSYLGRLGGGQALRQELDGILDRLQDTNLQRTDRMTMAHGLEGRVPFLDLDLVRYACSLPVSMLEPRDDRPEKWLLREAFRDLLPDDIANRTKLKFSEGTGSSDVLAAHAARRVPISRFREECEVMPGLVLRSPEELLYWDLWLDAMGPSVSARLVGRTRDRTAAGWKETD